MICVTVAPWPSVDNSTCDHCGAHVTDRFRRVFGDDDRSITFTRVLTARGGNIWAGFTDSTER
ncbi:hypothetical protein ELS17_06285 [Natrinema altunense]|uniref:Uncharacterized protein n=1 Tax=Natrinema altunense TaxID=222984 RepID=A0A482Y5I3_9EURY|nr:hypothetical protein ELS17_06285 [Natrinema altunense]